MATLKTNAQIDVTAAAVPAPYGPLTRVTDMDAIGLNLNSDVNIEFTTDATPYGTFTVYMTWDELNNATKRDARLAEQGGVRGVIADLVVAIDTLNTYAAAITSYTPEDYALLIEQIRVTVMPYVALMD